MFFIRFRAWTKVQFRVLKTRNYYHNAEVQDFDWDYNTKSPAVETSSKRDRYKYLATISKRIRIKHTLNTSILKTRIRIAKDKNEFSITIDPAYFQIQSKYDKLILVLSWFQNTNIQIKVYFRCTNCSFVHFFTVFYMPAHKLSCFIYFHAGKACN